MRRVTIYFFLSVLIIVAEEAAIPLNGPWLYRIEPLGATRGSTVTVELIGDRFGKLESVWFDSADVAWLETLETSDKRVRGRVSIEPHAALGPHLMHLRTDQGRTNTRLFNVVQFRALSEAEPNDPPGTAQLIELKPQVIQGYLTPRRDIDIYRFEAKQGERWTFDLRSLEYGSHLECEMSLTDDSGREVDFNDDRDDYVETPFLEHTFRSSGFYRLKLDQYRGPQNVDCAQNCGYLLQISQLPVIHAVDPLGLEPGLTTRVRVFGRHLDSVREVWSTPVRAAEYYRLTFPFTVPLRVEPDPPAPRIPRVNGRIVARSTGELVLDFAMPADTHEGLWRLWLRGSEGVADAISLDVARMPSLDESDKRESAIQIPAAMNGRLSRKGEKDFYWIDAKAGRPIHAWTLAAQLGLPFFDTVLELFDQDGKLLAESDDLMTGQGTVIGNPDSSLYFTPVADERLRLVVRDRTGRGGPDFAYRLKVTNESPGFRLLTEPEEFRAVRGTSTRLSVLLIPDPGFKEAVETWIEALPAGVKASRGEFRPEQHFGPSGDGDNINIPEVFLDIEIPESLPSGDYRIRVLGRRASGGPVVEAFTTLWIGPPRKRNDVRRPLPAVTMTVIQPN